MVFAESDVLMITKIAVQSLRNAQAFLVKGTSGGSNQHVFNYSS